MKAKKTVQPISKTKKGLKKPESKKVIAVSNRDFAIVGIGASAGGLEALEEFFKNMPDGNGMAFVVIQHLDPTHIGIMPELLQRITTMKVYQASDQLIMKPNCVYVIPPNKSMSVLNGALHLFDPVETRGLRLPIDVFFRSLADDKQEKSIGIILSGMGSDGSLGFKAIKEKHGLVMVQDPDSAKFNAMPKSAIAAVDADIVASAAELPVRLLNFLKFIPAVKTDTEKEVNSQSNLNKIIILLREQSGHDFSLYKKNTLFRRIERRKNIHQIGKTQNYVRFLQENPKECDILFKELLIGVTSFFRDTAVWKMLKEKTLPALIKDFPDGYAMRAWVAGCSTGEEAYSLAIIFKEVMEKIKTRKNISLQIFATDIDKDAVAKARKGWFPKNIKAEMSTERLNRFFTEEGDGYRLHTAIREMVIFAPQNVIKDPPFTKLDFLSCRNMLIYMETELQKKLINLFNYSLNPGGIMMLGTAETLGGMINWFENIDSKLKIFKRNEKVLRPELIDFPSSFYRGKNITPIKKKTAVVENIQQVADQILLQQFAPASLLVNDKGDIIYISGRTGKYLEPAAGKASWNIYAMARKGLSDVLPGAFRKVADNYNPVTLQQIKIGTNGGTQFVDVTVQRIENPATVRDMIMVIITDVQAIDNRETAKQKTRKEPSSADKNLELDLQRSYEELQSTREEMQTSQEELKSTNEELQSTNEELQSTNEELSTSKEEMQSLNEELQTVNIELQSKINDFMQANNDMKNLLNSTEIATLFLDKELNIRRFTEAITDLFKLRKSDIGRPFTDLVSDLKYPEIETHAQEVLKTLVTTESSIITKDGRWFTVRIMPYRTLDDRIDGLVITFTDTTVSKKLEIELKEINEKLKTKK